MWSFLALGFLIGLRHALEPDHVAAVLTITTRGGGVRDHARAGILWGMGHALTLLLLAGGCIAFGVLIPAGTSRLLEGAVGVMLVMLGVSVFVRMRRDGVHIHAHRHGDRTLHVHAHRHASGVASPLHALTPHVHSHQRTGLATVVVGAVHGLAGSAALVLLAGSTASSPAAGIAYVALFGLGAIVGMMVLTATVALPARFSTRRRTGIYRSFCSLVGAASILIGLHISWTMWTAASA
jgi:ABC-type nickel/cobalt efflux system permease component RcnA